MTTVIPGGLDLFFEELSAALPPGVEPNLGAMGGLYQKYGIELLGPPLGKRQAA